MQDDKADDSVPSDEEKRYTLVPNDFPRPQHFGAVAGMQPKFLATKYQSKLYLPGSSPPELYARWNVCEDLAKQLAEKSLESKSAKRAHMTESAILEQYLERLLKTGWVSDAEGQWTIRRTAELLRWPSPARAEAVLTEGARK